MGGGGEGVGVVEKGWLGGRMRVGGVFEQEH